MKGKKHTWRSQECHGWQNRLRMSLEADYVHVGDWATGTSVDIQSDIEEALDAYDELLVQALSLAWKIGGSTTDKSASVAVALAEDREEAARIAAARGEEVLAKNFTQLAQYLRAYAKLRDGLSDPAAVHANILRGEIALTRSDALHIAGATDYDLMREAMRQVARCAAPTLGCGHASADDCLGAIESIASSFVTEPPGPGARP